jgi:hypothetical protein
MLNIIITQHPDLLYTSPVQSYACEQVLCDAILLLDVDSKIADRNLLKYKSKAKPGDMY